VSPDGPIGRQTGWSAVAFAIRTRARRLCAARWPSRLGSIGSRRDRTGPIEHIFLGYDHIAFLLAVVLWARRLWPVVKVVTTFTVAHSVTLSLATLGIVEVPCPPP